MHFSDEQRTRLFAQLDALLEYEDWEQDDTPVTLASFNTFLRLILFVEPEVRPGLGATSDGNLIAAWTSRNDTLTVTCKPIDEIRWVTVIYEHDERESAAGITHVERIMDVLQPYIPDRWFKHEEER